MPVKKHVPTRMCIGCQVKRPKREMVRIVRTPEGDIAIDFTGKRSGRGAYVCPEVSCLETAISGGRLSRALETEIRQAALQDLGRELREGIQRGILPASGRSNRRG